MNDMTRRRAYQGPRLFSQGFRPFFLAASFWAVVAQAIWLGMLAGRIDPPTAFGPVSWHVHEMIFGFVTATIAGFMLTAIPNWTGRLPVRGTPLICLVALWLAGRLAVLASEPLGAGPAAAIDVSFLVAFCLVAVRELVAGK
ncbi:MAG: NnrS family protein, partial [Alphaproteobacteria bacterium]